MFSSTIARQQRNGMTGIFFVRCCRGLLCKSGAYQTHRGHAALKKALQGEQARTEIECIAPNSIACKVGCQQMVP
jgi:hypothetical protein